jgi:hypothetical protein
MWETFAEAYPQGQVVLRKRQLLSHICSLSSFADAKASGVQDARVVDLEQKYPFVNIKSSGIFHAR